MATMLEAKPLVSALDLAPDGGRPFRVFRGRGLCLAISGIGKVNAALAVSYMALELGAKIIVNLGAAGAAGEGASPGHIFQVERVIEFDGPRAGDMRIGRPELLSGFPGASLATRDVPTVEREDRMAIAPHAELVDMEGSAVLRAAKLHGLPCYMFKIVSDTPDHITGEEIVENIRRVRGLLCDFFLNRVLKALPEAREKFSVDDPGK